MFNIITFWYNNIIMVKKIAYSPKTSLLVGILSDKPIPDKKKLRKDFKLSKVKAIKPQELLNELNQN